MVNQLIKKCPVCEKVFNSINVGRKKYCSKECFIKIRYKKHCQYMKKYRENNKEKISEKRKKLRQTKDWKEHNREYVKQNRDKIIENHKKLYKQRRLKIDN